jgi:aspartate kinase
MKFGGTSVGSPERIKALVELIGDARPKIVVLSAMVGTTNSLVEIANLLYANDNAKGLIRINALEKAILKLSTHFFIIKKPKAKAKS